MGVVVRTSALLCHLKDFFFLRIPSILSSMYNGYRTALVFVPTLCALSPSGDPFCDCHAFHPVDAYTVALQDGQQGVR